MPVKINPIPFRIVYSNPALSASRNPRKYRGFGQNLKSAPTLSAPNMGTPTVRIAKAANRYYLDYYERLPNGKKKRCRLYVGNRIKDPRKRRKALEEARNEVLTQLSRGQRPEKKPVPFEDIKLRGVVWLIRDVIDQKKYLRGDSLKSIKLHLIGKYGLSMWLTKKGLGHLPASEITKQHLINYRDFLLRGGRSNRTVNNYMDNVNTFFKYLLENFDDLIAKNPCQGLHNIPTESETHLAYTDMQARQIIAWLKENDPYLHFYCKFVVYAFLRPKEVRKIQLKHFDLEHGRIVMPAGSIKTRKPQIKYLPAVFVEELRKSLPKGDPDDFLFTFREEPGPKMCHKDFFPRRFAKLKKALRFSAKHTMYGLRHTYVSQLIRNKAADHVIMKYTGHTTMAAFEKYKRSLMAEAPKDISKKYSVKF